MFSRLHATMLIGLLAIGIQATAQTSGGNEPATKPKPQASTPDSKEGNLEGRVEKYLRNLYAWGPSFEVKIGSIRPSPIPELLEVPVSISMGGQSNNAVVYTSKDGKFIIRGELTDMSLDPLADIKSKLHPGNSPSLGPLDAKITLIEFADFECPSCRELDRILRVFLPAHPNVRLVYKHFPLTDLHPWAMTAAIAGQCAFEQNPEKFWKIHDAIFDAQDLISPSNVWGKMIDLATQQGLNEETFKTCMASPEAAHQVQQNMEEGRSIEITGTPTTFVNGRQMVGPDASLLNQYSDFELPH